MRIIKITKRVLGEKHSSTLTSINNLTSILSRQDKYEETERIHRQALMLTKTILNKKHSSTLTSINNLVLMLSS